MTNDDNIIIRIGYDNAYPTDDMLKFITDDFLGVCMLGKKTIKFPPYIDYNVKLKDIILIRDILNQLIDSRGIAYEKDQKEEAY